jgi:hypothetical protein
MRAYYKVRCVRDVGRVWWPESVCSMPPSFHPPPSQHTVPSITPQQPQQGGFLPEMTRREAAQILGLRESAPADRVREAHRRIMIANHPDAGGSSYLATKVNEAKDMLLGKAKRGGSVF